MFKTRTMLFAGALAASLTVGAMASDNSVNEQLKALRAELDAVRVSNTQLQGQVSQLRSASDENWLNERRAQEVRSLIKEVLADADTRASLLEGGMAAGHNGKHFFLASEDGSFKMTLGGQIQFRYIGAFRDNKTATGASQDGDETGFQMRRVKLKFKGHIADPKITYGITLAYRRSDGLMEAEEAKIGYKFDDNWSIAAGLMKLPFLRQELTSSSAQLAVDRGLSTEYFTLDYSEQVQLNYSSDNVKLAFAFSDTADASYTTIGAPADDSEIALTARADVKLAGNWKQLKDASAWSKDDLGIFLGAAIFYQLGDATAGGGTVNDSNYTSWTLDGLVETNGFSLFAAVMGANNSYDGPAVAPGTQTEASPLGVLVESGYMVIPDKLQPFVRWEMVDYDSDSPTVDNMSAVTFGFNWFMKKHKAKLTTDLVWVYEGTLEKNGFANGTSSDGLGTIYSDARTDDLFVFRTQFQLLF